MTSPNQVRHRYLIAVCLVLMTATSCGTSGPARYQLTGAITYQGKPVPAGTMRFEPVGSVVNKDSVSEAEIKDGEYATLPGRGVVGGPHRMYVFGFNGIPEPGSGPMGASIFEGYVTEIDLPEEASAIDIVVPDTVRALQPF